MRFILTVAVLSLSVCVVGPVSADPVVLLADGFGDGDRDNDGRRVERVENRDDVGAAWFAARGTSDMTISIADDTNGIGRGNTLGVTVNRETSRFIGATFPEVPLEQVGDRVALSFDVRVVSPLEGVQHERRFRFGLYHDGGTPVTEDSSATPTTEDDKGYFVQLDVGEPDETTADIRGNQNKMLLGGSYNQSFGANTDSVDAALSNNEPYHLRFSIERLADDDRSKQPSDYELVLDINGETHIRRSLSRNQEDAVVEAFNTVYIGTSNIELEYRIDNVKVEAERSE